VKLARGWHLGYRRLGSDQAGTWIARYRPADYGKRRYKALGEADDKQDGDGRKFLTFADAQRAAETFFKEAAHEDGDGEDPHQRRSLTVSEAIAEYLAVREVSRRKCKSVPKDRGVLAALVTPTLGNITIEKLTERQLKDWRDNLVASPARKRSAAGAAPAFKAAPVTDDERRARQATFNRVWAAFRAALNYIADARKLDNSAWRRIKPFENVSAARIRWLDEDEARRLVNASQGDFKDLVIAGLLTGARYGELTRATVADYNGSTLYISDSKSGKPRYVALVTEAQEFFARMVLRRSPNDLLFTNNGRSWKRSDQQRPFNEACKAAHIKGASFHCLRHSYASRLVNKGVPLAFVADQLGHSNIEMVTKHYGHLQPSHVADVVRAAYGTLGIVAPDNVRSLKVSG
jgi:integrase